MLHNLIIPNNYLFALAKYKSELVLTISYIRVTNKGLYLHLVRL